MNRKSVEYILLIAMISAMISVATITAYPVAGAIATVLFAVIGLIANNLYEELKEVE